MKYRVTVHKEGTPDQVRTIDAASRFVVYEQIQGEGAEVIDIAEVQNTMRIPAWLRNFHKGSVKHRDVARMAKNLSTMITAGLPLSRALSVIERESASKNLSRITVGLSDVVSKGSPFHAALAEYPLVFPELLVAMVRVGEESGSLAESLNIVGTQMEHSEELTRKIKGALIYPCIVVIAIVIVSVLMLIYVVPTLTKTFADLKVELPLATRVFVAVSDFLVAHTILVILSLVLGVTALLSLARSKRGSAALLWFGLKLPVIGELIRETYAARTARTLSSLLTAGVPVLGALTITRDVVHAHAFASVIAEAEARVKKGEPLSKSFEEHPTVYPILMSEMLAVGEETGKVAPMLKQAAEFYEDDVSQKTKDLSTIIEPLLMLLIGAVVGVFAVSMIAPIYSISSAI